MTVRTRFAPSPTGYLHVGGARTALFNWLFARHHGGVFVLRIEDTDEARNSGEAAAAIFDGLRWLGIDWDEGPGPEGPHAPYFQGRRRAIYDEWFDRLAGSGRVYEDGGAWRFRFQRRPVTVNDLVCGEVTIDYRDASNTPDMVVRRSDGSYVFHFVNVVDDLEMGITHVIRGEDHLMNTPKHLQLVEAFGMEPPKYAHIPLILNPDGSKMSKRDAGASLGEYGGQGFLPSAVVNFLALLGWSAKTDEEVFTPAELVRRFSLEQVNRAPARFDMEKCRWMNQRHLQMLDGVAFAEAARPFVEAAGLPVPGDFAAAAACVRDKVRLLSEVPPALAFLVSDDFGIDAAVLEKVRGLADAPRVLVSLAEAFDALAGWSADSARAELARVAGECGLKAGQLMFPLRAALSGRMHGPDIGDMLAYLGRERSVARLRHLAELVAAA